MPSLTLLNLTVLAGLIYVLYQLGKREQWTLSRRVLLGLVFGTGFGFLLTSGFGENQPVLDSTLEWTNIIGSSYVSLLRMIIMPLILITMIAAVLKVDEIKSLGKIGGTVVSVLIVTTVIAALIGAGGLGDLIFNGVSEPDIQELVVGTVVLSLLTLAVDYGFGLIERVLRLRNGEDVELPRLVRGALGDTDTPPDAGTSAGETA